MISININTNRCQLLKAIKAAILGSSSFRTVLDVCNTLPSHSEILFLLLLRHEEHFDLVQGTSSGFRDEEVEEDESDYRDASVDEESS